MNPPIRYFVRVGAEVRGPYDVAQLRQLGEVQVITPATEAATNGNGPWFALATTADATAIFPPRLELALTEAKFAPTPDAAEPLDLHQMIAHAQSTDRVLRPSHPPELAAHFAVKAAADPNDVEAMVRAVQDREAQFAPPPPPPKKWRPGRRLVLIAVLAILGNALLGSLPFIYDAANDVFSMLVFRGWFVIYNGGLAALYFVLPKE